MGTEKDQIASQVETTATPEAPPPSQESLVDQYEFDTDPEPTPEPETPAPPPSAATATSGPPAEAKDSPAPEEQPQEAAKPNHPEALVRLAEDLGISSEEIETSSPEGLALAIRHIFRTTTAKQPEPKAETPEPEPEIDLGLDESQYEPGLIGAMKKLARENAKELKAVTAKLEEYEKREQARDIEEKNRRIDGAFESLGPDFEAHFGKGSARELGRESPELARRFAVLSFANQMKGDAPLEKKLQKAANLLYQPSPKQQATTPPAAEVEKILAQRRGEWAEGGVARPTHRESKELPKGPTRAKQTFNRELKAAGLADDSENFDESVE